MGLPFRPLNLAYLMHSSWAESTISCFEGSIVVFKQLYINRVRENEMQAAVETLENSSTAVVWASSKSVTSAAAAMSYKRPVSNGLLTKQKIGSVSHSLKTFNGELPEQGLRLARCGY